MSNPKQTVHLEGDNTHLANFCGPLDENLRQIAVAYDVQLRRRGEHIIIEGLKAELAADAVRWFHDRSVHKALNLDDIQLGLVELKAQEQTSTSPVQDFSEEYVPVAPVLNEGELNLRTRRRDLRPRTPRQREYLAHILNHDITFGVGPAGTGKTF